MQFNWASFGSGISSVFIILLLCFCYRKNKRANRKARKAELHEIISLASRDCYVSSSRDSLGQTGIYPPSSGHPGPCPGKQPGKQLGYNLHSCNPPIANYSAGPSFCLLPSQSDIRAVSPPPPKFRTGASCLYDSEDEEAQWTQNIDFRLKTFWIFYFNAFLLI